MAWTERYVRSDAAGGGDGTTNTNSGANGAWTLAEAITNVAAGHRVNVRAGTYANTTTNRTFATAGTTTAPIWWRGFNTSIGDIDSDNSLTKPAITFTTGRFIANAQHQYFSNLDISGAAVTASSGQLVVGAATAGTVWFDRCRIENTAANANGAAFYVSGAGNGAIITRSRIKATTTATSASYCSRYLRIVGCLVDGGDTGILADTSSSVFSCVGTIVKGAGAHGIRCNGVVNFYIANCTVYSSGTDGIRISGIPTLHCTIHGCILSNNGGYGINNSTGTDTNFTTRMFNSFYSNTSGPENGFGDSPSIGSQTETSSPFTAAGSDDFSLATGALAISNSWPGDFETLSSLISYLDCGAVQKAPGGGGGGLAANPIRGFIG